MHVLQTEVIIQLTDLGLDFESLKTFFIVLDVFLLEVF